MAYTPINWQTGDTITAEKLNRCDNGWSIESTQLFSETVTTVNEDDMNSAVLTYASPINAPMLYVTFDGTDYTCPANDFNGTCAYGGFGEYGPDFTDYPFLIIQMGGIRLYTETAGSHTVAASAAGIETSSDFASAVNSVVNEPSTVPMKCATMVTTYQEMLAARDAGRLMYTYLSRKNCVLINSVPDDQSGFVGYYPLTTGLSLTFDNDGILQAIQ